MASVFSHPAVAVSLFPWFRSIRGRKTVLLTGIVLTILPDLDIIGFRLGIPYGDMFGHRGITHSLFAAIVVGGLTGLVISRKAKVPFVAVWSYFTLCMASHGILDAITNGGLGIAFFAPFVESRYFLPFQPIEVSSLSIAHFFQGQGIAVLKSELLWIGVPCIFMAVFGIIWRARLPR